MKPGGYLDRVDMARRQKACGAKKRFGSRPYAEEQIARLAGMGRWRVEEMDAYQCEFCGHWHMGHKNKPDRNVT